MINPSTEDDPLDAMLREQIDIDLRAGGLDNQRSIGQRALAGASTISGSAIQPGALFGTTGREVSALGETIAGAIRNVLSSVSVDPNDHLVAKLLAVFDERFQAICSMIRAEFGKAWRTLNGGAGGAERLEKVIEDKRRAGRHRIRLMVEQMKKEKLRERPGINIEHSQVGFLQAGIGNTAEVASITIGPSESSAVIEILRQIEERVTRLENVGEEDKVDLCQTARDAAAELAKPKPNRLRLRGLIFSIATAIQTTAALNDLYNSLAPHLPSLGLLFGNRG